MGKVAGPNRGDCVRAIWQGSAAGADRFERARDVVAADDVAGLRAMTGWLPGPGAPAFLANRCAAKAGFAPDAKPPAKSQSVPFRGACDRRLRTAITGFAEGSGHEPLSDANVYDGARAGGCRHPHVIRISGRA